MTQATLTLDGIAPMHGTVETGGDYIRFRTADRIDGDSIGRLREGRIEIGDRTEKVMVKAVQPGPAGEDVTELTLQRFAPSAA